MSLQVNISQCDYSMAFKYETINSGKCSFVTFSNFSTVLWILNVNTHKCFIYQAEVLNFMLRIHIYAYFCIYHWMRILGPISDRVDCRFYNKTGVCALAMFVKGGLPLGNYLLRFGCGVLGENIFPIKLNDPLTS